MKRKVKDIKLVCLSHIILALLVGFFAPQVAFSPEQKSLVFCKTQLSSPQLAVDKSLNAPKIAIVIDDFGCDRQGVEEMFQITGCTLTCAVMPCLEFSESDATRAHNLGHEVIVHMPMETYASLPLSWYGPLFIKNTDADNVVEDKLNEAFKSVPFANGINIHMGTAVSQNERIMTKVLNYTKQKNLPFLDSRTIEGSVCKSVADKVGAKCLERDVFLEVSGSPNYSLTLNRLSEAVEIAKQKGTAIIIGHVGPVGSNHTARAIKEFLPTILSEGIKIVPLSEI